MGDIHNEKDVYLTFCLWHIGTSQLLKTSQSQSNGRCLRGVLITAKAPTNMGLVVLYISAWASALLVLTG